VAALWVCVLTATEMTVTDLYQVRTFAEEVYTTVPLLDESLTGSNNEVTLPRGTAVMLAMFFLPPATLTIQLTKLPVLGVVPVLGVLLMIAGAAWSFININSLPMVVDMTEAARIGTYTGLYYLFSTLSAIAGPNVNGWIVQLTGGNYNNIMIVAPFFMVVALGLMIGVKRGEAVTVITAEAAGD